MITFKVSDIPDGESWETRSLEKGELDLGDYEFAGGELEVHFDRQEDTIRLFFTIRTQLTLICDRSLKPFLYDIDEDYEVIYRFGGNEDEYEDGVEAAIKPLAPHDNIIQIDQEVRDTVLLSIPAKKLHPRFLNEEGEPTDFQATFGGKSGDPRWEPLKSLKNNLKNNDSNDI